MPDTAVFLRAINVGGRRVTNADLVRHVVTAGFDGVSAYQAAGNLLLDAGGRSPDEVAAVVEAALQAALGYTAEAFTRAAADLDEVLARTPFAHADVADAAGKPQIGFLRQPPDADLVAAVEALGTPADRIRVLGRELHWLPVDGVGRSALDLSDVSRELGPMTVRTEGTVQRVRAKLG